MIKIILCATGLSLFVSCSNKNNNPQGDWIKGTEEEKIKMIEKHFRGFDNAMVEIGYRYHELYWAGQDENWEYAHYQADKIKIAIEGGLQRRPKRAKSAEHFLTNILPEMNKSIEKKDTGSFKKSFYTLTASCNSCHAMEKVPFFKVEAPAVRQSSIRK
jgi:hypothetical protein